MLFISAMFEADVLNGFCMGFCSGIKSGSIDALPRFILFVEIMSKKYTNVCFN